MRTSCLRQSTPAPTRTPMTISHVGSVMLASSRPGPTTNMPSMPRTATTPFLWSTGCIPLLSQFEFRTTHTTNAELAPSTTHLIAAPFEALTPIAVCLRGIQLNSLVRLLMRFGHIGLLSCGALRRRWCWHVAQWAQAWWCAPDFRCCVTGVARDIHEALRYATTAFDFVGSAIGDLCGSAQDKAEGLRLDAIVELQQDVLDRAGREVDIAFALFRVCPTNGSQVNDDGSCLGHRRFDRVRNHAMRRIQWNRSVDQLLGHVDRNTS